MVRIVRVQGPEVPAVGGHRCTLQCLCDELAVVHVDLIGEPACVCVTTDGHVRPDVRSTEDTDALLHRAVRRIDIEDDGSALSELPVLRPRDQIEEAVVVHDAVRLGGGDRPRRQQEDLLGRPDDVDGECGQCRHCLGRSDRALPHAQEACVGDGLEELLTGCRVLGQLDLGRVSQCGRGRHRPHPCISRAGPPAIREETPWPVRASLP